MRRGPVLEGDPAPEPGHGACVGAGAAPVPQGGGSLPALPLASWTTPDTASLLPRVPVWEGLLGPRSAGASLPGLSAGSGPWCAASRFLQLPMLELLKTTSRQACVCLMETTSQSPQHSCELVPRRPSRGLGLGKRGLPPRLRGSAAAPRVATLRKKWRCVSLKLETPPAHQLSHPLLTVHFFPLELCHLRCVEFFIPFKNEVQDSNKFLLFFRLVVKCT